jgi:hypothetical protein
METLHHRGALWALVRRHYGSVSEKEQTRVYRRLQQRRRRHADGLRKRMKAREACIEVLSKKASPNSDARRP